MVTLYLKLSCYGSGSGFYIPIGYIRSGTLDLDKKYKVTIEEVFE